MMRTVSGSLLLLLLLLLPLIVGSPVVAHSVVLLTRSCCSLGRVAHPVSYRLAKKSKIKNHHHHDEQSLRKPMP